jgi:tetratricopeptide (TPR) repeat protein
MKKAGLALAQSLVAGVLTLFCVSCVTTGNEGDGISHEASNYYNLGVAYAYEGDYDRAITNWTLAIRLAPNYANAYYNRGVVYAGKGDYNRAIADLNHAVRLSPNDAKAYHTRGIIHADKGDYEQAITDWARAIRLDPNYVNKEGYDRAIADLDQAIKLDPNDRDAYYNRGLASVYTGE